MFLNELFFYVLEISIAEFHSSFGEEHEDKHPIIQI